MRVTNVIVGGRGYRLDPAADITGFQDHLVRTVGDGPAIVALPVAENRAISVLVSTATSVIFETTEYPDPQDDSGESSFIDFSDEYLA